MGLFDSGGGGSQTTSSSSTVTLPLWLHGPLKRSIARAEELSEAPFRPYDPAERIAPLTADERAAFDLIRDEGGAYRPYIDESLGSLQTLLGQLEAGPDQAQIQSYMNPYLDEVLERQLVNAERAFDIEKQKLGDLSQTAGAFGGSRFAVQENELADSYLDRLADVQASESSNAFLNALNMLNADRSNIITASGNMANIAGLGQNQMINEANLLQTAGQQQRLLDQALADAKYQEFQRETAYPYESLNFLSQILQPAASMMRGEQSTQTTTRENPEGSLFSKIAGVASTVAGLAGGNPLSIFGGSAASSSANSLGGSIASSIGRSYATGGLVDSDKSQFELFLDRHVVNPLASITDELTSTALQGARGMERAGQYFTLPASEYGRNRTHFDDIIMDRALKKSIAEAPAHISESYKPRSRFDEIDALLFEVAQNAPVAQEEEKEESTLSLPEDKKKEVQVEKKITRPVSRTKKEKKDPVSEIYGDINIPLVMAGIAMLNEPDGFKAIGKGVGAYLEGKGAMANIRKEAKANEAGAIKAAADLMKTRAETKKLLAEAASEGGMDPNEVTDNYTNALKVFMDNAGLDDPRLTEEQRQARMQEANMKAMEVANPKLFTKMLNQAAQAQTTTELKAPSALEELQKRMQEIIK